MKNKTISSTLLSTFILGVFCLASTGCASAGPNSPAGKAISEAKAAKKKAASVGGEWRDIGKFIKNAEKAAKDGDAAKATKLANKAKAQADDGYTQAMNQAKITKEFPSYMK